MESLKEIVQYIQPNQRGDVIAFGLNNLLGLTVNEEIKSSLLDVKELLIVLLQLSQYRRNGIARLSLTILINLSAEDNGAERILLIAKEMKPVFELITIATDNIIDANCELADSWCMLLNNLTRHEGLIQDAINALEMEDDKCLNLAEAFFDLHHNKKNQHLDYIASIFCNIAQTAKGRQLICCNLFPLIDKFVPHIKAVSKIRRRGVIGLLKNICFEDRYHEFIFDEEYNALPNLLYLLCGPEKYNENDLMKIHPTLRDLPDSKKREADPTLRIMILETLLQLCANRLSRADLRDKGVYEILREYHKWELAEGNHNECLSACEKVVDILIKTEDEIGVENYRAVEIPSDLSEKFTTEDHI